MKVKFNTQQALIIGIFLVLIVQLGFIINMNNQVLDGLAKSADNINVIIISPSDEVDSLGQVAKTGVDVDSDTSVSTVPLENIETGFAKGVKSFTDVNELMEKARKYEYSVGKVGGTFNYAHSADAKTFNLILNKESITCDKLVCSYDYMLDRDPFTQEFMPYLAESWEISNDGLVCDIHLRKDVKFHDGHPLSADDVVFTYNDLLDNKEIDVGGKGALLFRNWNKQKERIEELKMKVEKVDDYTVRFTFPFKTFRALDRIKSQLIYPKHILKKYVDNGTFNTTWDISTDPREIIGSGKYMPWEYIPGERFVVKRNPNYWKKDKAGNSLPYIDRIFFHTIVSHDTAILKFLAGELDFIPLSGEDVPVLQPQQEGKDFTIFGTGPSATISYMVFNMNFAKDPKTNKPYVEPHKLKWFTNVKFRQAMSYALDRETWISNFMNGFGVPLWGPLSPASVEFYNPNVRKYPFDLIKAGELLDEIGYIDRDNDGIREDPEGNNIEFAILGRSRTERDQRPVNMFISDLSRIGVRATYIIQQSSTFLDSLWTNFSFECAFIGELAEMEVDAITKGLFASYSSYRFYKQNYSSDYTPNMENINNNFPWEKEIDRLCSEYMKELDRNKRKFIGYEIQEILSEELPLIFTVTSDRVYAIRNKWKNFCPTTGFHPSVWRNFEYMYEQN